MFDLQQNPKIDLPTIKENLRSGNYDHVWTSEGTRDRKRAAINKAEKIFQVIGAFAPGEVLPLFRSEVEFFFYKYLRDGTYPKGSGLRSLKHAESWCKEFCQICDVAQGSREAFAALQFRDDDWGELIANLRGKHSTPRTFNNYEMIPITSLARECRRRGIAIADLTKEVLCNIAQTLAPETVKAIITAVDKLYHIRGSNFVPDELLPPVGPDDTYCLVPPTTRVVPPLPHDYVELMENYISAAADGRVVVSFGTEERFVKTKGLSKARIKNIYVSLRWLGQGISALGLIPEGKAFDQSILSSPVLLYDVVDACAIGRLGPICDTSTRRAQCNIAVSFLRWVDPSISSTDFEDLFRSINLKNTSDVETEDKIRKRKACLSFIRDEKHQLRFFDMPGFFFDTAKPLIANFNEIARPDGNGVSREQNRALEIAIMAALTAINTRFPARLSTLNKIEIGGKYPHVLFPTEGEHDECALLDIPGYIVKNGRYATGVPLMNGIRIKPKEILKWYIDDVHPLVLKYKHKHAALRRPDLLFTGLHDETIRRYWRTYTVIAGLDLTPHMCRHFTASLLLASGVAIEDIAELLCISVQVAERNYAFVARNAVIQNVMEAQAKIYRNLGV
jgi:hypothetical protein